MPISLCGASGFQNTGIIDCDSLRGNPKMLLVGGTIFSPSNYVDQPTLDAAIIAATKLGVGSSGKLFPFPVIQGTSDKTVAAKTATLGYGLEFKLVREKPTYEFEVLAGSSLEKKLISFDGKTVPILILDDTSQIWGTLDGSNNFVGARWQLSISPRGFGDAANAKSTKISISLIDSADFVENSYVYKTLLATSALTGLKDVNMSVLSFSSNVYKIRFNIPTAILGSSLNIYDLFGALLAPLTFTAFTGTTFGTSLAITSIAVDATLSALTVTFDSTAFTALPSLAKIKFIAPIPSVLDVANVTGIEIAPLIITKP